MGAALAAWAGLEARDVDGGPAEPSGGTGRPGARDDAPRPPQNPPIMHESGAPENRLDFGGDYARRWHQLCILGGALQWALSKKPVRHNMRAMCA